MRKGPKLNDRIGDKTANALSEFFVEWNASPTATLEAANRVLKKRHGIEIIQHETDTSTHCFSVHAYKRKR